MAVQNRLNVTIPQFELAGNPIRIDDATVTQDAGRTTDLLENTLMAKNTTTGEWVPFTDAAGANGTGVPRGIIKNTIPTADLVAGDVTDVVITVGDLKFDENLLVIENSLTLETVLTTASPNVRVRDWLYDMTLYAESAQDTDRYENP